MSGILGDVRSTMPGTWVGHGLVCLGLTAVGIAVAWAIGGDSPVGGVTGSGVGLVYYWARERRDKLSKLRDLGYTERDRLDRVGDLLAAAFIHAAAWLMYGSTFI